jgi:hypothetical protein
VEVGEVGVVSVELPVVLVEVEVEVVVLEL